MLSDNKWIIFASLQHLANVQGVPIQNELIASPIDCKGKDFYCVDSKNFIHCFDVNKNGQTQTVGNKAQLCAGPLFCDNSQPFECMSTIDPGSTTAQSLTTAAQVAPTTSTGAPAVSIAFNH